MHKPLPDQVVVITGASSGIGRETALRFASRGAGVVLVARNQDALQEVAQEIAQEGGRAIAVPADVADYNQVQNAAGRAVQEFGRIDTWVNNAGVTIYGTFEQTTPEEFRRVVDVNLMGQVHGAKAALPHLKRAGGGTLIGITSSVGQIPVPLLSAYGASKNGLMTLYRTLRLEQQHQRTGVRVSVIVPASINTPLFDHALSHLGVKPGTVPPVYDPGLVADAILYAAEHPTRRMVVGTPVAAGLAVQRAAPRLVERVLQVMAYREQRTTEPEAPGGPSNLWQPMPGKGSVRGRFRSTSFDPYTWLQLRPAARNTLAGLALAGLLLPVAAYVLRRPRRLVLPAAAFVIRRSRTGRWLLPVAYALWGREQRRRPSGREPAIPG